MNTCNINIFNTIPAQCERKSSNTQYPLIGRNKSDVFFKALNKNYNMDNAKSEADIPDDVNILLYSLNSKVNVPKGKSYKECVLSNVQQSWWQRNFGSAPKPMTFNNNHVEYIHGNLSDKDKYDGSITLNNSKADQIEHIYKVNMNEHSKSDYISDVEYVYANDSDIKEVNNMCAVVLNGNCTLDYAKGYQVNAYPGDKVNKIKVSQLYCKPDFQKENVYSEINEAETGAANIEQAKIKKLKTLDLDIKNSHIDNLKVSESKIFENVVVNNLEFDTCENMKDVEINKFELLSPLTLLKLHGKTQINELTLNDYNAKLFVYPSKDNVQDNYIKKINVQGNENLDVIPKVKIQGDIDIDTVEFKDTAGVFEVTQAKNDKKPIKVINGIIRYNAPEEEPIPYY